MRVACRLLSAPLCWFPGEESKAARLCDREIHSLATGLWHLPRAWSGQTFEAALGTQIAVVASARFRPASAAGRLVPSPAWSRDPQRNRAGLPLAWPDIWP